MKRPDYLKNGDIVRIISTARKINREELQVSIKIIESWGLKVELGPNLFEDHNQFAGTDKQRLEDFQNALNDASLKAIFFARGGYGTVRIIDAIDWKRFSSNSKWLVGYSDVTVIHNELNRNELAESIHGTMPVNMANNSKEAIESLKKALFGETIRYTIPSSELNRNGKVKAELVGGNLSILYSLLGTNSDIDTKGKILLIEDLDEYLYHVDRMMYALKKSGKLEGLSGLIVGTMSDMNDNKVPYGKTAKLIISEAVQDYSFPVCFGAPFGHQEDNRALYLGRSVFLEVDPAEVRISF